MDGLNLLLFLGFCYAADLILKDPRSWPHPVRLLGRGLNIWEKAARSSFLPLQLQGFLALGFSTLLILAVISLLLAIPILGTISALYLGYTSLALGGLLQETVRVRHMIARGSIDEARAALAMLVSRDTSQLDEQGLYRTLAETAAENYNDAFCAPFFYLSLLGVPWVWVYKLVSTMDSMWGYKTAEWKELGQAGAMADDILAWIPARTGALSMLAAARVAGLGHKISLARVRSQAGKMESPNAGWTMSAAALILNMRLGGKAVYKGVLKDKPVLGPEEGTVNMEKIDRLVRLILISSFVYLAVFAALGAVLRVILA
ncbi:MAG: adenosylcobinamide-phosphate synthase CbiB [Desulfonatronovibrionaceae bacterium]